MLSRLWRPLSQSCDVLPKILNNIAPATFTTLHSTGSRKPSEKQRCNFTPLSGIKQNESHHLSSQRLFHISGQNYKNKIDWNDEIPDLLKYLYRKIRLSEYQLRKYSPQAITESASDDVKPYLRLMRFDRPIGELLLYLLLFKRKVCKFYVRGRRGRRNSSKRGISCRDLAVVPAMCLVHLSGGSAGALAEYFNAGVVWSRVASYEGSGVHNQRHVGCGLRQEGKLFCDLTEL